LFPRSTRLATAAAQLVAALPCWQLARAVVGVLASLPVRVLVKVAASWMLAFVPTWALAVGVAVGVPQSVLAPVKELARTEARQHARTSASRAPIPVGQNDLDPTRCRAAGPLHV